MKPHKKGINGLHRQSTTKWQLMTVLIRPFVYISIPAGFHIQKDFRSNAVIPADQGIAHKINTSGSMGQRGVGTQGSEGQRNTRYGTEQQKETVKEPKIGTDIDKPEQVGVFATSVLMFACEVTT